LKRRLEGLETKATIRIDYSGKTPAGALWKTMRQATQEEYSREQQTLVHNAAVVDRYPSVVHPAVLEHPDTGRKCLLLSPSYVDQFLASTRPRATSCSPRWSRT